MRKDRVIAAVQNRKDVRDTGKDRFPARTARLQHGTVHKQEEQVHSRDISCDIDLKIGPFTWPIRIALSGLLVTPGGAIDLLYILGKEESLRRITKAIEKI